MTEEAFFRAEGEAYLANPISAGPWRASSLMGRAVCGLIGHVIEKDHLDPGFVPARFTVELFDFADFSPLTVATRRIRDGGRMRLVEAELICGGRVRANASCQLLRHTEAPEGRVWSPPDWDAPPPEQLIDDPTRPKWRFRVAAGSVGHIGLKRAWMQDYRQLIAGAPLTPFARAALAADFASPFSHAGDRGIEYINTDTTLYLHRLPEGEWIGVEATDHQATAGLAVGQVRFYDQRGPIGFGAAAALAQRKLAPPQRETTINEDD
ncbi:MAG: thioesterase family protein [Caulobacteraceae bacterium]|nr:thioesterase family protein [Caulobacteraceae bacterium]